MDSILTWGLNVVRDAQSLANPALTLVMKGISLAGTQLGYLAIIPLVYWCVDKRRGMRIGILVFFSSALNQRFKLLFAQPRPFDLDPSVNMTGEIDEVRSFGLPSGHSQSSAVLGGSLAPLFRSPLGLVVAFLIPLLVGISRIYLGEHFPTDVIAGWAIGAAIVGLERLAGDRIERAIAERRGVQFVAAALSALAINALSAKGTALAGVFSGFVLSAIFAKKAAPFSVSGGFWKKALRYLVGIAIAALIFALPKMLPAKAAEAAPSIFNFFHYALLGAWVSLGAPWLFLKLGLAEREPLQADARKGGTQHAVRH
jgi:membrane-associated phospholipid phosphatase